MKWFKTLLITILIVAATSAFAANKPEALPSPQSTPVESLDRVMVVVNGELITQAEFNQAYQEAMRQQRLAEANGMPYAPRKIIKKAVMDGLIKRKIQLQIAKRNRISPTQKDINSAIARVAKTNHISVSALYKKVSESGFSRSAYRQKIKDQLTLLILQRQFVGRKGRVTDAEVAAYQNTHGSHFYHVGDIRVPLPDKPTASEVRVAMKKAIKIKKELTRTNDFQRTSLHFAPKTNTILDWSPINALPDLFASSVKGSKSEQVLGPIRAPNGFHVLYIFGIKKNRNAMTDKQVRAMLYQEKSEKILKPWLRKLRETASIQIVHEP